MRKVIVNTSPLQYLYQLGQIELLPRLYGSIIVPESVNAELVRGYAQGVNVPECEKYEWMLRQAVRISAYLPLVTGLGAGEKEVIALALEEREVGIETLVVLDDGLARHYAAHVVLAITGTLGILLKAREQGYLQAVMPLVEQLAGLGFRCNTATREHIRQLSGE
jgi:hypothetical protein